MIAALVNNRRLAVLISGVGYGGVFAAFVLLERPGLGIGHFFYLPVCLVALATDAFGGAVAGLFGAGLYCIAVVVDPQLPSRDVLTAATGIRAITLTLVGCVIGLYANRNRQLIVQLHDHASTDFVTGVANVRAFSEELERRCATAAAFSVTLVDIDELRHVNEVHGRAAGDVALRRVAEVLSESLDSGGLVARVGGDEFALLTGLRPAGLAADVNAAMLPSGLSVTAASTAFPADGQTADDLFKKADDRLFAAKLVATSRRKLAAV